MDTNVFVDKEFIFPLHNKFEQGASCTKYYKYDGGINLYSGGIELYNGGIGLYNGGIGCTMVVLG